MVQETLDLFLSLNKKIEITDNQEHEKGLKEQHHKRNV